MILLIIHMGCFHTVSGQRRFDRWWDRKAVKKSLRLDHYTCLHTAGQRLKGPVWILWAIFSESFKHIHIFWTTSIIFAPAVKLLIIMTYRVNENCSFNAKMQSFPFPHSVSLYVSCKLESKFTFCVVRPQHVALTTFCWILFDLLVAILYLHIHFQWTWQHIHPLLWMDMLSCPQICISYERVFLRFVVC